MQTANDPFDTGRILGQLARLGGTIASFVERERQLVRAHQGRLFTLRRAANRQSEDEEVDLATRIAQLESAHQQAVENAALEYAERRVRITHAFHSSRALLAKRTADAKDLVVGRAQTAVMRTKHLRLEELAGAEEKHRGFEALLGEDAEAISAVWREARRVTRGYPLFRGLLAGKGLPEAAAPDLSRGEQALRADSLARLDEARAKLAACRRQVLPALFRYVPLSILLVGVLAAHALWLVKGGAAGATFLRILPALGGSLAGVGVFYLLGLATARPAVRGLASLLDAARRLHAAAGEAAAGHVAGLKTRIQEEDAAHSNRLADACRWADEEAEARLRAGRRKLDDQLTRLPGLAEALHEQRLDRMEAALADKIRLLQEADERLQQERAATRREGDAGATTQHAAAMDSLAAEWKQAVGPPLAALASLAPQAAERFPAWNEEAIAAWTPPADAVPAVPIGHVEVEVATLAGGLPQDPRLALPGPARFPVPVSLLFSQRGSLLVETDGDEQEAAAAAFNQIILRLLANFPPGRLAFTILDPVGLGKNFAGLMHLADYEETLINSRIWTQSTQIEEKLGTINEHIEKVIQMYLRNEFADITEYNEQAGTIAEKFHFLVVAGFPAGFNDNAAKRLLSIATSGARCGVFLLVHRDLRLPPPEASVDEELRKACLRVRATGGRCELTEAPAGAGTLVFDAPPADDRAVTLVHKVGKASIDSNRVEVPFAQISPDDSECWSLDTTDELRVPIGRTGARKLQHLALGKGTRQHVLIAGKTGSGKSTLFHVMVTNLALWCPPDQVEFYLVDFKKGVEFKCYATHHLPHARVVAIESDREFGLSVLQRVDAELKHRGEKFRKLGVQDVAGYKRAGGRDPLPRTLLVIDEFQEFFTEDDPIAQNASLLLDRIVRQGRAFGIHVILGSQTLGGAYTLARATLGQMVVRIALQCNEADAYLIMDDDNPAPRLLNRPGEGIYNDNAGAFEANSPFQTVWLPEDERSARLAQVAELGRARKLAEHPPVVFEGNAPADVRDNAVLARLLRKHPTARPATAHAWLGAPNSIKGPTEAVFRRQSGSNLLIVGQREETALALLGVALVSLAAHYPAGAARFVVIEPTSAGSPAHDFLARIVAALPHDARLAGPADLAALLDELAAAAGAADEPSTARPDPETFVVVRDLQRFKKLRQEDDYRFSLGDDDTAAPNPAARFNELILEGAAAGIHLLATVDTYNNLNRWINRKALSEFEMRVLFQMSANDSANLIDAQAAGSLGLHRALLYNEHEGTLETFRPYALPDPEWTDEAGKALAGRG